MKKLSPKQKRIAKLAPPFNKITGADFKKLKRKKKKKQLCLVRTRHQERNLKDITPK